jgi:hypothetical protein
VGVQGTGEDLIAGAIPTAYPHSLYGRNDLPPVHQRQVLAVAAHVIHAASFAASGDYPRAETDHRGVDRQLQLRVFRPRLLRVKHLVGSGIFLYELLGGDN